MFLMGPLKQIAKMFEKGRIIATVIYIVAMGLTLWAALHVSWHTFHRDPLAWPAFAVLSGPGLTSSNLYEPGLQQRG